MYGFYGYTAFLVMALSITADVTEIGRLQRTAEVVDLRTGSMCWVHKDQFIYASRTDRKELGLTYSRTHTAVRLLSFWKQGKDDCALYAKMTLANELIRPADG